MKSHDENGGFAPRDGGDDGHETDPAPDSLFEEMERRALFSLPDDDDDDVAPDLVGTLANGNGDHHGAPDGTEPAEDLTLEGYLRKHSRAPAFEGSDGQPYTVDVEVMEEPGDAPDRFVAFLIFIRWAATGAGIMDHVESGDIARGASEEEARRGAQELSLYEIKAELDAAITRRRTALED
jgi:hypothetical protein